MVVAIDDRVSHASLWTSGKGTRGGHIQGYLAHKKRQLPKTLQYDYAYGPPVVLEG